MKIYIAGKITGEPVYDCFKKFEIAQRAISQFRFNFRYEHGVIIDFLRENVTDPTAVAGIINPLQLNGIYFGINNVDAMRICLKELSKCDVAYFLNDWQDSEGAKTEHDFCIKNNVKIIYQ